MSLGVKMRLSLMMFLQYYVWGIWLPMLGQHLGKNDLNLDQVAIGWIFTVYGFGAIVGPFILGELADRYFSTERLLAVSHFIGGILLIGTAYARTFVPIFTLLLLYCSLYMATMSLTNSITFRTLGRREPERFPDHPALGDDRLDRGGPLIRGVPRLPEPGLLPVVLRPPRPARPVRAVPRRLAVGSGSAAQTTVRGPVHRRAAFPRLP